MWLPRIVVKIAYAPAVKAGALKHFLLGGLHQSQSIDDQTEGQIEKFGGTATEEHAV